MKRNLILAITLITCFWNTGLAQEFSGDGVTVELSDPIVSKKNYLSYLITGDNDVVFSRNTIKKKPYLVRYNENMEEDESVLLTPDIVPKRSFIERIVPFGEGLVVFYSTLNKKAKTNTLYYVILSQEDLSTLQEAEKIFGMSYSSKRNSGNFDISRSRDSTKLLVFANTPFKRARNAKDEVSVVVLDQDFSVIWDDKLTIPYTEKSFSVQDYDVDNHGNVYILGKLYKEKSKRERKKPVATYKLLAYTEEGSHREEYGLNLSDKFISEIDYIVKDNGDLLCAGLFSNQNSRNAAGAFYLEIEQESMDVLTENIVDFGLDFFTEGMSDRQERKVKKKVSKGKDVEFTEYDVRHLVEKEDGGLVMVAEQYFVRVTSSTDANGRTTYTYHYYYNDIIVVSFDEDGEIEWNEKIQKVQYSVNDGGYLSGFNLIVHGDVMHFFFVETGNNVPDLGYTKQSNREDWRRSHLVHATVDIDGEKTIESMGRLEKLDFVPVPRKFRTMNDGRSVIYLKTRREHRIGKINVEG
ncbi:MAG: hypothetical protein JJ975_17010 [Bacteroidia bacterium]|nr:hypothetical protein [Bacteroidia bacterium]